MALHIDRSALLAAAALSGMIAASGAAAQEPADQYVGEVYHHCSEQTDSNNRKACTEYHLREDGQALRLFWRLRVDTQNIENHSISHRAWRVVDGKVVIQGEFQQYGRDSIMYYDVHSPGEDGALVWEAREVDGPGGETEVLDPPRVYAKEGIGVGLFATRLAKDQRFSRPDLKNYKPEVYWSEVVSQYPARYLRD